MRRNRVIVATLGVAAACMVFVSLADAQRGGRRRRRGRRAARQAAAAPRSAAIAEALGELRWGMTPRQVHTHFANQIRESYRERLQKAPGTIEEDRLRHDMNEEIRELRRGYTRFTGRVTGWDASFLRGEFTHGNRESMIVRRDGNSQNFYFFIGGRFWKWFKAFDASVFQGQPFAQFARAVQTRFGTARERTGRLVEGGPQQRWLEWQDETTRLRAIDQTRFYGFYCLVFEEKNTLRRLPQLRTHTQTVGRSERHSLVDSVVLPEGESAAGEGEPNADIVDRITGHVRRRQDGARAATKSGSSSASSRRGSSSSARSGRSGSSSSGRRGSSSGDLDLSDL